MSRCLTVWLGVIVSISLSGCAKHQPHWVELTWDAPRVPDKDQVAFYTVYRTTSSDGKFAKLASPVKSTSYQDHLVLGDRTYFYAVSATDRAGQESPLSNKVQARIPK